MPWNSKKYARINWKNRPSVATPLGATLLNKIDVFLNEVDNQLIEFEARKLNIATANSMISNLSIDVKNGIVSATQLDGTVFTWDLNLEKIPVSFSLSEDGVLTMITDDGTRWTANISELIKDYVFDDSETIVFSKEFKMDEFETKGSYRVTASIKEGSVGGKHLNPDYRADIQSYKNEAQAAASDSEQYAKDSKRWATGDLAYAGSESDNSKYYSSQSKSYAVGTEGEVREGDSEDNAKYYYEQSKGIFDEISAGQVTGVKGNEEKEFRRGNINLTAENIGAIAKEGDASLATITFQQASEIANIQPGDNLATAFGKLSKLCENFSDKLTQLNGKIPARYAGSASAGGSATSAVKLDTATAGSATQPVHFSGGKPVACTHTLAKSVPANAVFTDTNTWRPTQDNLTSTSKTDSLTANMGRVLSASRAYMRKTGWGTRLAIEPSGTGNLPHGIVMFANHTIYGIWVAGNAGAFELNKILLHGNDYASFSINKNSGAITASWPSNIGVVYIGA